MEKIKKFIKKPVTWIVVITVALVGVLTVINWDAFLETPEQNSAGSVSDIVGGAAAAEQIPSGSNETEETSDDMLDSDFYDVAITDVDDSISDDSDANADTSEDLGTGTPTINKKLTWSAINSFPIKKAGMDIDEARQLCVDFFRFTKTALWTPKDSVYFIRNASNARDNVTAGTIYGSLPYVTLGSGNIYRMMDYINESTGVVDIADALNISSLDGTLTTEQMGYFGNQCSIGAYWGWGRVINSADYRWTEDMIHKNGFLRIGPYTYTDGRIWNKTTNTTTATVTANGEETMFKSYAELKVGDGLVYYTAGGGHVMMCATNAVIAYEADGVTIDGANSYITIIDQGQLWIDASNASGDKYKAKSSCDAKYTFEKLYENSYVPFTFAEWKDTDPIEETTVSFSYSGSTITLSQLFKTKVTSNYGISDVYISVTDNNGKEIYRHAVRAGSAGRKSINMIESGAAVDSWGKLTSGTYHVQVFAQLSTGERPTVYTGRLVTD